MVVSHSSATSTKQREQTGSCTRFLISTAAPSSYSFQQVCTTSTCLNKQCYHLGTKYSNIRASEGYFPPKPLQPAIQLGCKLSPQISFFLQQFLIQYNWYVNSRRISALESIWCGVTMGYQHKLGKRSLAPHNVHLFLANSCYSLSSPHHITSEQILHEIHL